MFVGMIENYIAVLNRGGVPNIATAYDYYFIFSWEDIVEKECIHGYE